MIAALLLLQTTGAVAPSLGTLPRQQLPAQGCAAYLWSVADGRLVAVAAADPARLRLSLDGAAPADLPRVAGQGGAGQGGAGQGEAGFGLASTGTYRAAGVEATLTLSVAIRTDLRDGAPVPQATLTLVQPGRDEMIVPLAGLIGCRPADPPHDATN